MNKFFRARALWLAGLLALAPVSFSQTMELYAGQSRFLETPGTTVAMQVGSLVAAPDGYVYVTDINGWLMRVNPDTGNVTALPAPRGGLNYQIEYGGSLAVDAQGRPHVKRAINTLARIEPDGTLTDVATMGWNSRMAFTADGSIYFTDGGNRVFVRRPTGLVEAVAGSDDPGFAGDGGPASDSLLNGVSGIAVAANGDLYISDSENHRVRKITRATGIISTYAGTGSMDTPILGAPAWQSPVPRPLGLAFDPQGNLHVGSAGSWWVLKIDAVSGIVTRRATVSYPEHLSFDGAGNLYYSDFSQTQSVNRMDAVTGAVTRLLGMSGYAKYCGVSGALASEVCLFQPIGLEIDATGGLMVAETAGRRMNRIDPASRLITQYATLAEAPIRMAFDSAGNLFTASYGNYQINRVDAVTRQVTIVAGGNGYGFSGDGGPARSAHLAAPVDVVVDSVGNYYIMDAGNTRIRRVDAATGIITTFMSGVVGTFDLDAQGNLIVSSNCTIQSVDTTTRVATRMAGTGTCFSSDVAGGAAASTTNSGNASFAIAPDGTIYLSWYEQIYRVNRATGVLTRVPFTGGVPATPEGVRLRSAEDMVFDSLGNLFITDGSAQGNFVFKVIGLLDSTPPVIYPQTNGIAGTAGWYRSNVQISWAIVDPESAVTSSSGCTASSVTQDTEGTTFTCTATSAGGTATHSVTVKRDTVAPTLTFGNATPGPNASGWNSTDVSIPFEASDALSGVYSSSHPNPILITDSGFVTEDVVVTDLAGNSATFTTPVVRIDRAPPELSYEIAGTLGNNGWYRSDVQVTWDVNEAESPVTATQGCDTSHVTADTEGTTFTCSATSTGGTTTLSVTVKRDTLPPQVQFGAQSPAPNPLGWNTSDVSIPYSATDALSGIGSVSEPSPVVVVGEGPALSTELTVTDGAGNSITVRTPEVNIEHAPPTITPVVTGTLGNEGWYRSDVNVTWDVTVTHVLAASGCDERNVTTDTAGVTFTCSVTSGAGTTSRSVTVKRDATPPVLTWRAATPAANAAGWNRANVSFPYNTPTDARSGVASVSAASPVVVSAEGTGVTASVTVTDRAGNSAVFTTAPRNIDKTAPTVTILTPASNAVVGLYANAAANFTCVDAVSGVTSCSGTQANGTPLNTRVMNGWYTFRVTGTDAAGNSFQRSHNWSTAGSFIFDGYLAPMQNDPGFNLVTAGSRVPMRFRLPDRLGGYVSDLTAFESVAVASERCLTNVVALNDTAVGNAGLSFDAATSTFTYNWDTDASWAGTCRNFKLRLIDGSRHTLMFKFQ